ncbi:CRISPR-associated protein Csm5 [Gammaproteobacteria bacterium]
MVNQFLKHYRLVISTLSPIHIGCGEDYEPTNYVVHDRCLYPLYDHALTNAFADRVKREDLARAVSGQPDLRKLQQLYNQQSDLPFLADRFVPMTEQASTRHKQWATSTGQNCVIERTIYNPATGYPILPGTSLKGAIRTAILNVKADQDKMIPIPYSGKPKELETRLLGGSFETDPMRHLKIGDADFQDIMGNDSAYIMTRHSRHRKDGTTTSTGDASQNLVECATPFMPRCFVADVTESAEWKFNVTMECNQYYFRKVFMEQIKILNAMGLSWWGDQFKSHIADAIGKNSGFLLQVGKNCGADTLSIKKFMKLRTKHNTALPLSTTLCGIENNFLSPFGWLFVEILPDNFELPLIPLVEELNNARSKLFPKDGKVRMTNFVSNKKEVGKRLAIEKENREHEAEAKRIAEEQRQAKTAREAAEKAVREARLTAMTPNQRKIEDLRMQIVQSPIPQPISGKLWQDANKLVANAEKGEWMPDEKAELNQVCREELPGKLKDAAKKLKELHARLGKLMVG